MNQSELANLNRYIEDFQGASYLLQDESWMIFKDFTYSSPEEACFRELFSFLNIRSFLKIIGFYDEFYEPYEGCLVDWTSEKFRISVASRLSDYINNNREEVLLKCSFYKL